MHCDYMQQFMKLDIAHGANNYHNAAVNFIKGALLSLELQLSAFP